MYIYRYLQADTSHKNKTLKHDYNKKNTPLRKMRYFGINDKMNVLLNA